MAKRLPKGFFDRVSRLRRHLSTGIQLVQALALFHLGDRGPSTISELQEVVGRSRSSTSALVDQLEKRGFLTRAPSPEDRRRREIRLTDRGREVVQGVEEARRGGVERALADVPAAALRQLDAALEEVLRHLPE